MKSNVKDLVKKTTASAMVLLLTTCSAPWSTVGNADKLKHPCLVCVATKTDDISATCEHDEHDWNEFETVKEPTCTEEGIQRRFCQNCGKYETQEVPPLGHTWGKWTVLKPVTDTEDGTIKHICTTCENSEEKNIEKLSENTHTLSSIVNLNGQEIKLMVQDPYGMLNTNVTLEVAPVEKDTDRWNEITEQYDGKYDIENIAFFDIHLIENFLDGTKTPFSNENLICPVKVLIQIPTGWDKEDLEALLIAEGQDVEFDENLVTIEDKDYLAFWANHFSPYAMLDKLTTEEKAALQGNLESLSPEEKTALQDAIKTSGVKTGDNSNLVITAYISSLLLGAVLIIKLIKKKEN